MIDHFSAENVTSNAALKSQVNARQKGRKNGGCLKALSTNKAVLMKKFAAVLQNFIGRVHELVASAAGLVVQVQVGDGGLDHVFALIFSLVQHLNASLDQYIV